MIEANPRASRTVPFVSKAIGLPLAKLACRIMLGERIADLDLPEDPTPTEHVSVKEAVLPFDRFDGADAILGPEMRSTGEVMGVARDFPTAFAKAQAAAGAALPQHGTAFITVTDRDKAGAVAVAQTLHDLGFGIVATRRHGVHTSPTATSRAPSRSRTPCTTSASGSSPRAAPRRRSSAWASRRWSSRRSARARRTSSTGSRAARSTSSSTRRPAPARATDGWQIRRAAIARGDPVPDDARRRAAAARAIAAARGGEAEVLSLQEIHRGRSIEAPA